MRSMAGIVVVALWGMPMVVRAESEGAKRFWATEGLHTIHIRVTAEGWKAMQPMRNRRGGLERVSASAMRPPSTQPSTRPVLSALAGTQPAYQEGQRLEPNFYGMQFAYVKGDVECDGVKLKDVGVRLRGNSSFNWSGSPHKRPMKIDFNRFVEEQKLHGLAAIYLNNNAYDPSLLREALGYEAMRELGVHAPRTTLAMMYLTIEGQVENEYLGVYTVLEEIDSKVFLKEHFGSAKGMLLKPWSIRGLPYLGEEWAAYESRYNAESGLSEAGARRTIDFIKLVNYADDERFGREIEGYLDADGFLRLLAGHVMLSNLDNFLYTGHNFYMYLGAKDGRFCLMPWDLNLGFANFTSAASMEQMLHLSILRPDAGEMRLIHRLLGMAKYREAYVGHIRRMMAGYFEPARFAARVDALQKVLDRAEVLADEVWAAKYRRATTQPVQIPARPRQRMTGWQGGPAVDLKEFVIRRRASLTAQLAGQTEGFTPGQRRYPTAPAGGLKAGAAFGNLSAVTMAVMNGADADYDGKLTASEGEGAIRWFYGAADVKKEGVLGEAQLKEALGRALRQVDQRGRGERDRGDRRRGGPQGDAGAAWAAAVMAFGNGEKSAQLTLAEAVAGGQRAFAGADRDKSGKLDVNEVLELLDGVAASVPPAAATRPAR